MTEGQLARFEGNTLINIEFIRLFKMMKDAKERANENVNAALLKYYDIDRLNMDRGYLVRDKNNKNKRYPD